MLNTQKILFLVLATLFAPQIASAACYETKYTPATTDCSSRDNSGSADFQGLCKSIPAKFEQVEIECPGKWVQAIPARSVDARVTQTATCAKVGLRPAANNGYHCASGQNRPSQGEGWQSIIYTYGTKGDGNGEWGGNKTSAILVGSSSCHEGGPAEGCKGKQTTTFCKSPGSSGSGSTDVVVAYLCQ